MPQTKQTRFRSADDLWFKHKAQQNPHTLGMLKNEPLGFYQRPVPVEIVWGEPDGVKNKPTTDPGKQTTTRANMIKAVRG